MFRRGIETTVDTGMEPASQHKTLDVRRGLFLVKYESSESIDDPPTVRVIPEPGSENSIEFITPPDVTEAVLWSPELAWSRA